MKKRTKLQFVFWSELFVGITFAYFVYLTWQKLTEIIGDSTTVWIITGSVVAFAILLGHLSIKELAKRFT